MEEIEIKKTEYKKKEIKNNYNVKSNRGKEVFGKSKSYFLTMK